MTNHMRFRPYQPDQLFLLPPDLKQWLPEDDLVYFIIDVVNELNLEPIYAVYDSSKGGQPAYNPRMMVGLLLYAYCVGMPSSRKIEQVIVAAAVTQQPVDRQQMAPMIQSLSENTNAQLPAKLSADNGYYSEANCQRLQAAGIDADIATGRLSHNQIPAAVPRGRIRKSASKTERMARKLKTIKGRKIYSQRKHIVEPVFGQIKEIRGFRRFSFRGLEKVAAEWNLICLTHNLLKLFRAKGLTACA